MNPADSLVHQFMACWATPTLKPPHVLVTLDASLATLIDANFIDRLRQLLMAVRNRLTGDLSAEACRHLSSLQQHLLSLSGSDGRLVLATEVLPSLIHSLEDELSLRWARLQIQPAGADLRVYTFFFAIDGYPEEAAHSLFVDRWPMLAVSLTLTRTPEDATAEAHKARKTATKRKQDTTTMAAADCWVTRISDEVSLSGCQPWCWPPGLRAMALLGLMWCHDGPTVRRPPVNNSSPFTPEELILFISSSAATAAPVSAAVSSSPHSH